MHFSLLVTDENPSHIHSFFMDYAQFIKDSLAQVQLYLSKTFPVDLNYIFNINAQIHEGTRPRISLICKQEFHDA